MLAITDYYNQFYYGIMSNATYGLLLTLLTKLFFDSSVIPPSIPHFLTCLPQPHTTQSVIDKIH